MSDYIKLTAFAVIALFAAIAGNFARDLAYLVHAMLIMVVAGGMFVWQLRRIDEPLSAAALADRELAYMDGPVRFGVIATAFWGVVGCLVGTYIAFQLAFPALNIEWA